MPDSLENRTVNHADMLRRALCGRVGLRMLVAAALAATIAPGVRAQVHGVWVWKGPEILQDARGQAALRDFCVAQGVNEAYVAVSSHGEMMPASSLVQQIGRAHV